MRSTILLFALYLTALAVVPCQDSGLPQSAPDATEAHHDHDEDQHADHCTPFCICACCSATLNAPPEHLARITLPASPTLTTVAPRFVPAWNPNSTAPSFWQPPRA